MTAEGLYCSTSGTYFTDKESLAEHYKSDFHRYNLKRKVANLPPVTREWFDAHIQQLAAGSGPAATRVWVDPLTNKKFGSEQTYNVYVNSNKYKELVRRSGVAAPGPIVRLRTIDSEGTQSSQRPAAAAQPAPFHVSVPNGVRADFSSSSQGAIAVPMTDADDASSGWETASDDGDASMQANGGEGRSDGQTQIDEDSDMWDEWDVRRCLFDNHMSETMDDNLEYMWKHFGFYLPDAEYLEDPEGLLKYLGAKLQQGHVPLYTRGDDDKSRRFPSLHAVQRHMVDTHQCKMVYEGDEEEYDDFYGDGPDGGEGLLSEGLESLELSANVEAAAQTASGFELVIPGNSESGKGKVLGSRQFARYYKQKYREPDARQSVVIGKMLARYRALGVTTTHTTDEGEKRQQRVARKFTKMQFKTQLQANVTRDLPRNVPY